MTSVTFDLIIYVPSRCFLVGIYVWPRFKLLKVGIVLLVLFKSVSKPGFYIKDPVCFMIDIVIVTVCLPHLQKIIYVYNYANKRIFKH